MTQVSNPHNVVTVGRLSPQKNQALLITAFTKIAHDFPNENLISYGEGELRNDLEDLAREYGIEERVVLPEEYPIFQKNYRKQRYLFCRRIMKECRTL